MMQKCNVKQNKTNTKNLLNANNNSRNKGVLFHTRAILPLFVLVNLDESATRRLLLVYQTSYANTFCTSLLYSKCDNAE